MGMGLTVGGAPGSTMTLTGGAVLVTGGSDTLSVPIVATGSVGAIFEINSGAALNMTGALTGTGGLTTALGGTLTFSAPNYLTGTNTINAGTVVLAGGANTLYQNQALQVNTGGTLNLNGNVQYVNTLTSSNPTVAGVGGTITGSAGSLLVTQIGTTSAVFDGIITGGAGLVVSTNNAADTQYLESVDDYSGATTVTGGALRLRDNASLTNTPSFTLNYGALIFDNSNLYGNSNMLNNSTPVAMNGGTLSLYGRAWSQSSETVGAVTLSSGTSTISAETGSDNDAYGPQTAVLTLSGLVRNAASGATVDFAQNYINHSAGQLGALEHQSGEHPGLRRSSLSRITSSGHGRWPTPAISPTPPWSSLVI